MCGCFWLLVEFYSKVAFDKVKRFWLIGEVNKMLSPLPLFLRYYEVSRAHVKVIQVISFIYMFVEKEHKPLYSLTRMEYLFP